MTARTTEEETEMKLCGVKEVGMTETETDPVQEVLSFLMLNLRSDRTMVSKDFRRLLLETNGRVSTHFGVIYEIKGKALGAGVYRVRLEMA